MPVLGNNFLAWDSSFQIFINRIDEPMYIVKEVDSADDDDGGDSSSAAFLVHAD